MKIKRLDHLQICIPTGNENIARVFYGEILQFQEIPKPESLRANGGMWYKVGDIQVHIGTEDFTPGSKRHPAFEVEDLDVAMQYFKEKNVAIKEATPIPNCRRFYVYDPFDNRIEFLVYNDK